MEAKTMKCLLDNQIILYLTAFGLTDAQKEMLEKHFDECDDCRKRKEIYANKIDRIIKQNRSECVTVEENLVDFFLGDVDDCLHEKIKQHLQTCESCQYLFEKLKQSPAPKNYSQTFHSQFSKLPFKMRDFIDNLQDRLATLAVLTVKPLKAAPVFLGSHLRGTKNITHAQGDIIVNVGCKKKEVKLFSTNDVELDSQKSDENGIVIFKDFIGGDYKLQLEGFEIIDIKNPILREF